MEHFKYETHVHTNLGSACGANTGAEMADYYKSIGYSGFVVTDHFIGGNTAVPPGLPWDESIEIFCRGYEDAKKRGDEIDFDVFFGFEYFYAGTEFLIYGLDKQWLIEHPQIIQPNLRRVLQLFKEAGALIIHAHPFRQASYIGMFRLLPDFTDAVEVINRGNWADEWNKRADTYADMYLINKISGGDSHRCGDKTAGFQAQNRIKSNAQLLNIIKNKEYIMIK
ncbi:MAG: PHP domain-containing protein [Oscillospiraceae bacterium]|nr:PHP domain-containing protein [Oscillospiraceae bacterium]